LVLKFLVIFAIVPGARAIMLGATQENPLLYRQDKSAPMSGEAEVKYLDGDFRVVKPGAFVRCAVTGIAIPLEELKYWSVDRQEAYASPEAVMQSLTGAASANA
jgi:hypothetical protein